MTSEVSDKTVQKCSLVRISPAHLQKIWPSMTSEGSDETVHNCSLLTYTQNWALMTSEGSDATVQKWSLVRISLADFTHNMEPKWPAKVQMRLCTSAVSSEYPLLHYIQYRVYMTSEGSDETVHKCSLVRISPAHLHTIWSLNDQWRLRWDCAHVQSRQNLPCSLTHNMEPKWPAKAQMRQCTSTVSSESALLTYNQYGA